VLNVIDFLERFGQDAELRYAKREALEEALQGAGIEPALRDAILGKNARALEALLGANANVCCAVHKEDEDEETEEDDEEDEDDDFDEDEDDEDDEDEDEDEDEEENVLDSVVR
jgi:hypothetical protein